MTTVERFFSKIEPEPMSGCWLWAGGVFARGYGGFYHNGTMKRAHRVSYQLFRGPIPKGLCICHKCDVPLCVNPDHLFTGTQEENLLDAARKGRARNPRFSGEHHPMARLSAEQIVEIRRLAGRELKSARAAGLSRRRPGFYPRLAQLYGVSPAHIRKIAAGRCWSRKQEESTDER